MAAARLDGEPVFGKEIALSVGNGFGCKFGLYDFDSFMIPNLM